jgi:Holliday junction DNA helicase RuvA
MISYIRGDVLFRNEQSVVIDVNGIGYEVFVPYNVLCAMERAQGTQVELYTYLQVKEDGIALFGFADRQELAMFKHLITVSGIGPKGALGILSHMSTRDLMLAVLAEDAKAIAKAPGIGAKTASKLIIELKDKFKLEDTFDSGISAADLGVNAAAAKAAPESDETAEIKNEAVQALTALGYSSSEALKAVRSVPAEEGATVEQLLKSALKYI